MTKILVTGATGRLGSAIVRSLIKKVPASNVIALARDARKALPLKWLGVDVRYGDYTDYESLVAAFTGVDKIYLVSASAFSDRFAQHKNIFDAARITGVRHVFYNSIQRDNDDLSTIEVFTDTDIATEDLLKVWGIDYTIVRHPIYAEELPSFIGNNADIQSFSAPAGSGRVALASITELAEAGAVLLSQAGHENRCYLLNSGQAWSFNEIAQTLSRLTHRAIDYQPISAELFKSSCRESEWSPKVTSFISGLFAAIEKGAFDQTSSTLENLLGRKPKDLETILKDVFNLEK
ncbi:NmrA family NAD(P)-binding protein [Pseudomonas sp. GB2N2]